MEEFFRTIDDTLFGKPFWFQAKKKSHKKILVMIFAANKILKSLICDAYISEANLELMSVGFDVVIDDVLLETTKEEQIQIAAYYTILENFLLEECESMELYESCSNIKRFYDFYYQYTKNKID